MRVFVVSDCHLGAGPQSGEVEHFDQDEAFAEFVDHVAAESGELIVAGDFFDTIQVRVDGRLSDRVYAEEALAKVHRVVAGHPKVFDAFARLVSAAQPLTFLVGNHDPALAFPEVRQFLAERCGGRLGFQTRSVERGALHIHHGNEWDGANAFGEDGVLRRDEVGCYVAFPWGSYLVIDFLTKVRKRVPEIERIKPIGAYLRWAMQHRPMDAAWVAGHFLRFVLRYRFHPRADQRISFPKLKGVLDHTCYSCTLTSEVAAYVESSDATVIVAGHTHRAMDVDLGGGKRYLNTGSWNPLITQDDEGNFHTALYLSFVVASVTDFGVEAALRRWDAANGSVPFEPSFAHSHLHGDS